MLSSHSRALGRRVCPRLLSTSLAQVTASSLTTIVSGNGLAELFGVARSTVYRTIRRAEQAARLGEHARSTTLNAL